MLDINSKLSGRYIITQPIGSGGMANVYLARDLILDRDVAVKVLKYDFQEDQDAIRRFQREAMAASQVLHQNIVEVYDVDEEDDQQYIVMEYVDGTDLKGFIRENAPLSLELVVNIMSQILSAIELAHKHGIIHRDIKPQNILITKDRQVKITDFGIAIALSETSLTQTNTLLGSVHYLSPEQARGGSATVKSDIYALGVVLYELITGEVPYDGESAVSIALKHFQEPFPSIRDDKEYIPQSLENVVLRATSKSLEARYPSAQAMLTDLGTSLSVNRMNERRFDPGAVKTEEPVVIAPIKPIASSQEALSVADTPEDEVEEIVTYDEIQPVKPPTSRRRIVINIILFAVLVLTVIGVGFLITNQVRSTTIPDVLNRPLEEATALIEEAGLSVDNVDNSWHDTIQEGNIISINPGVNQSVRRDTTVDLQVSLGKQQAEIGNYIGQNYETIRALLIDAGFIVERHDMYTNEPGQAGLILAQSLDPGTRVVPSASSITLTVGSYSDSSIMQDFYNLSLDMAESFADSYGLYVETAYEYNDFIPAGQIIRQSPTSGTPLYPGDYFTVVVSDGPEENEVVTVTVPVYIEYVPTYASNDREQTNPLPNTVQVFIGDANNNINRVAREFEISESTTIQISLYVPTNGTGQYRVIRDGDIVEESPNVYPE